MGTSVSSRNECLLYHLSWFDFVCGYVDSHFASHLEKKRSTSCYVYTLAR
jgi:hypothetical protein